MERRRESRIRIEKDVCVTLLSGAGGPPAFGRGVDLSGRGLSLTLGHPLPVGSAVKVEQIDQLLLGEVVYCQPGDGGFRIGIEVEQSLRQTRDLEALRRALHVGAGGIASANIKEAPHGSRTSPAEVVRVRPR